MAGSNALLRGDITVIDTAECVFTYKNHFCAGPDYLGGCEGDDGGATVCDGVLYGLVGWRFEDYCLDYYNAHMYIDVAPFHDWVIELTAGSMQVLTSLALLCGAVFVALLANKL